MSRLEKVVGTEIIDDIRLGHTWYEYGVLERFIAEQIDSEVFIEIGIHEGGLSYMLIPRFPELYYVGVEWSCRWIRPKVKILFSNSENALLFCFDYYSDVVALSIKSMKHKIIYCDGGGKAEELKYFKAFCDSGDILMSHDYHDGVTPIIGVPAESLHLLPKEVLADDIVHMTEDETFESIAVPFEGTRIVAWRKL